MLRLLHYGTVINTGRIYIPSLRPHIPTGHISCSASLTQNQTEPQQSTTIWNMNPKVRFDIYMLKSCWNTVALWVDFLNFLHDGNLLTCKWPILLNTDVTITENSCFFFFVMLHFNYRAICSLDAPHLKPIASELVLAFRVLHLLRRQQSVCLHE